MGYLSRRSWRATWYLGYCKLLIWDRRFLPIGKNWEMGDSKLISTLATGTRRANMMNSSGESWTYTTVCWTQAISAQASSTADRGFITATTVVPSRVTCSPQETLCPFGESPIPQARETRHSSSYPNPKPMLALAAWVLRFYGYTTLHFAGVSYEVVTNSCIVIIFLLL